MGDGDGRDAGDGARRCGASAALLQAALAAGGLALPWPRAWLCASSPWPPSPPGGTGRGFPIAEDRHKATELAARAPQKQNVLEDGDARGCAWELPELWGCSMGLWPC